jgi:hypothetical protein
MKRGQLQELLGWGKPQTKGRLLTGESQDSVEGQAGQQTQSRNREGREEHQRGDPELSSDPVRTRRQPSIQQSFWEGSPGVREPKKSFHEPGSGMIILPTDLREAYPVGIPPLAGLAGVANTATSYQILHQRSGALNLDPQNKDFVEMTPSWKAWKSLTTFPHFPQWLGCRFAESTFPQSRRRSFYIVHKHQEQGT